MGYIERFIENQIDIEMDQIWLKETISKHNGPQTTFEIDNNSMQIITNQAIRAIEGDY
jgi:hypothetical protein